MLSINTNLSSLIAQRSMKQSTNKLNQAIERMTTGAKINHAKDNAANYNIATNMTTKLGALQVAEDNALQGLEMINTTSETLSLIEDKLSRMRALSVQALNGTYGEKSLSAINSEAQSLLNEITRLNDSATYNGIKLFNTGKKEVTNAGKELELNEQGFLQEVAKRNTSTMLKIADIDETEVLTKGVYSVSTVDDLLKLHKMSKAGLLESESEYVLTNNIDLKDYCKSEESNGGWTPISLSLGFLDGNGYSICNLYINRPNTNGQGFLTTSSVKEVKNLKLENIDITAGAYIGAFVGGYVGTNCGDFVNCVATGRIDGENYIGGIIGAGYYSDAKYCYADMDIIGIKNVGGIYGYVNYGTCSSNYFEGSVTGKENVGGIAGYGSSNSSKVVAVIKGNEYVGGVNGTRGTSGSYFSGRVLGDTFAGGICGMTSQFANVSDCIMEGCVSGNANIGVFCGEISTGKTITDCYYYGKLVGDLEFVGNNGDSTNCFNLIDITIPCDYTLKIGSSGDNKTSTVSCTTYIDFGQLNNVLSSGIESTDSIEKIEELIKIAELKQVELGTIQNRLTSVLDEISTQYENLVSSRSTLQDADIAEVSSEYIRQQILQQASATLLATANQSPSIALQLI